MQYATKTKLFKAILNKGIVSEVFIDRGALKKNNVIKQINFVQNNGKNKLFKKGCSK
jgi:hypothetical protein